MHLYNLASPMKTLLNEIKSPGCPYLTIIININTRFSTFKS